MARSVNTTQKKAKATTKTVKAEKPVESAAVSLQPKAASKREQNDARISSAEYEQARPEVKAKPPRKAIAPARRVAVQYTPRIPGAHCPGC